MLRTIVLAVLLLFAPYASGMAQGLPTATPDEVGLSRERLAQAMEVLNREVKDDHISGAVFGVVRHGKLAWLEAVGFRDKKAGDPLRTDAIFPLASMTKPIASVAAMVLMERGQLALSDPLAKYLPAFKDMQVAVERKNSLGKTEMVMEPAQRPITIQDLLRHTAGMVNGRLFTRSFVRQKYIDAGVYEEPQTLAQEVDKIAALPLAYQPGTVWDYSQSVDVVARVVEVASGEPFDRFLAETITGPLKMVDTRYDVPEPNWNRIAEPTVNAATGQLPPHQDPRHPTIHFQGNTGLVATAGDYLRFCQMMLNGGELEGARVLGAGTVTYMTSDHLGPISRDSESGRYLLGPGRGFALGFSVRTAAGESPMPGSLGDYDWGGAFGTQFVIDPKQDMAAVLMINQQNQFDHIFRLFRPLVYAAIAK